MPRHAEERVLPFAPAQLFALVADVERYPEFLPWCQSAIVRQRRKGQITADLTIGYKAFRETFTSVVRLEEPSRISVEYLAGPLSRLANEWRFTPAPRGACRLAFDVDFAFRSVLLGAMMDLFFDKAFRRMVTAFEERARHLYGPAEPLA